MTSPAYDKECEALRLLHPDWDELSQDDRSVKWEILMYNVTAAADVGMVNWVENYGLKKEPKT